MAKFVFSINLETLERYVIDIDLDEGGVVRGEPKKFAKSQLFELLWEK
jgi:hypothetical protein